MNKKQLYAHPAWASSTFEGAELSILALGLKTTFREKLIWLEEAETQLLEMRAAQKKIAAAKRRKMPRKTKIRRPTR